MATRGRRVLVLVVVLVVAAFAVVPGKVDGDMNRVLTTTPPAPSAAGLALHRTLFVADLHADQLLWARDPLARATRGHVDVPRLQDGNVALQVFSVVTKTPRGINYDHNTDETDNILLLAIAQRWPIATWRSLRARALHQADRLHDAARRSKGMLTVIETQADLAAFTRRRATAPTLVGGLLAIEGLHALDGNLANVDTLFEAGFRMMGLTHFFDNELGGSAHGVSHAGLTPFGREVVRRMEHRGIIVDLAHTSPQMKLDVLAMATRPVVVSHGGVAATCPGPRNLTDDQLRAIAANGGLVGIGYWDGAVCEMTVPSIVRAIRHAVTVMGVQHVSLGSDFDGATTEPWDTRALGLVTDGLLQDGFSSDDVRRIMGGNVLAFLARQLPVH
ncbi:MAG: dipeptidase [Gemmatimonadaceae bacterium]|nr:dipeptidase [Gemmatimonadaceae bacterium]